MILILVLAGLGFLGSGICLVLANHLADTAHKAARAAVESASEAERALTLVNEMVEFSRGHATAALLARDPDRIR